MHIFDGKNPYETTYITDCISEHKHQLTRKQERRKSYIAEKFAPKPN